MATASSANNYEELAVETPGSGTKAKRPGMRVPGPLAAFFDKEFLAEFLSTFLLLLLGDGSVAQWMFRNQEVDATAEPFLSVNIGYGLAVLFGALVAGEVSGAHMNPAVSIAFTFFKKLQPKKLPKYLTAQFLGAFLGSLMVFLVYYDRLTDESGLLDEDLYRGIFATYPHGGTRTGNQLLDQIIGTAILLIVVCSLSTHQLAPGMGPVLVGLCVTAIGTSFGTNCGYPINPARDFAPRIVSAMLGYDSTFSAGSYYFWVPIIGPIIGGFLGTLLHYLMIDIHRAKPAAEKESKESDINGAEMAENKYSPTTEAP